MASLSNFSGQGGQQTGGNGENLTLSECTCPICLYILVEPVTMPCQHELCRRCFQKNVQEASLTCPLCRRRISTWARKAAKNRRLVNQERWEQIQNAFPVKVANRLEGLEDDDDSDDEEDYIYVPNIAAPGEIREEYEKELRELEAEREQLQQDEEEASRDLIRQLQEEEETRREEQEQLRLEDEQLVRRLMAEADSPSIASVRSTPRSTMLDRFVVRGQTPPSHSSATDGPLSVRPSPSPGTSNMSRLSRNSIRSFLQTPVRISSGSRSSSVVILGESDLSADLDVTPGASPTDSAGPSRPSQPEKSFGPGKKGGPSGASHSAASAVSERRPDSADSLSQELCHFKPIHCSPRTPPRRVAGVRGVDPPVIRSTPRNLSHPSTDGEDEGGGIPDGSPVMRRRLSQLDQERKEKVAAMSKSTGPDLPLLPTMRDLGPSSPDPTRSPPTLSPQPQSPQPSTSSSESRQGAVRTLSFDAEFSKNNKPPTSLILPLEPHLDSDPETEENDTQSTLYNSADSTSKGPASKSRAQGSSPSGLDTWLRISHQRQKDRDKDRREESTRGGRGGDCMNPEVTTTLLTPNSLLQRQQAVRLGNYIEATPEIIRERKISRASSKSETERRVESPVRCSETKDVEKGSEPQGTAPSVRNLGYDHTETWHPNETRGTDCPESTDCSSPTRRKETPTQPASRGNSPTPGCSTDMGTERESQADGPHTKRKPSSEGPSPPRKVARVKPRLQGSDSWEEETGRPGPGGDKGTVKRTQKKNAATRTGSENRSPVKSSHIKTTPEKTVTEKQSPVKTSPRKASPVKDSPAKCTRGSLSPAKKTSPQKEPTTPTRRSRRQQAGVHPEKTASEKDSAEMCLEGEKSRRRISSEHSEASSRDGDAVTEGHKPGLKRVRSTEDKENEGSVQKDVEETPPKRQRTASLDLEDYSSDEVFQSPKKAPHEPHFSIEYSPEAHGKRLKKFAKPPNKSRLSTKGKQSKLCFVKTAAAGSSGSAQSKLMFTAPPTKQEKHPGSEVSGKPGRGRKQTGCEGPGPGRGGRPRRLPSEDSEEDDDRAPSPEDRGPPAPCVLDRSHFTSDTEYKEHLEEQDRLLALQLQADFDLECKLRLTAIRRKGTAGQYELRRKTSSTKSSAGSGRGRAKRSK